MPVDTTSGVLDVEKTASGFGGIISVNAVPVENLNIALRYETATALDFESKVNENGWEAAALPDSSFTDGYMQRRDLPGIIAGGVSYRFSPEIKLSTSFMYYMLEAADQGENDGINDNYGNGLDLAVGIDYQITPCLLGGLSYLRSDLGGDKGTYTDLEYNLDYNAVGAGVRYTLNEQFSFTLAGGRNFYEEGQGSGYYEDCTYNKKVWYFGLGAEISLR